MSQLILFIRTFAPFCEWQKCCCSFCTSQNAAFVFKKAEYCLTKVNLGHFMKLYLFFCLIAMQFSRLNGLPLWKYQRKYQSRVHRASWWSKQLPNSVLLIIHRWEEATWEHSGTIITYCLIVTFLFDRQNHCEKHGTGKKYMITYVNHGTLHVQTKIILVWRRTNLMWVRQFQLCLK